MIPINSDYMPNAEKGKGGSKRLFPESGIFHAAVFLKTDLLARTAEDFQVRRAHQGIADEKILFRFHGDLVER
jgi:hypothetical protein